MRTIEAIHDELRDAAAAGDEDKCVALCREGIRRIPSPQDDEWYAFRIILGRYLVYVDEAKITPQGIQEALKVYLELTSALPKESGGERRATACLGLGWSYYYSTRGDIQDNLRKAVEAFNEALNWYTRESDPHQWAGIKAAIAFFYSEMDDGANRDALLESIRLNEEALQVFTASDYPDDFKDISEKLDHSRSRLGSLNG